MANYLPHYLLDALDAIAKFFHAGGTVIYLIAILSFVLYVLICERFWYYWVGYKDDNNALLTAWRVRPTNSIWGEQSECAIRDRLISQYQIKTTQYLSLIKTLITLCPLFGLLGTVTGMIEVFTVLSVTGGGNAKLMAAGISRATLPTMAGMVVALCAIFANIFINRSAMRAQRAFAQQLI